MKDWAKTYTQKFNLLSEQYNTSFYTQSPLNVINNTVELMVIGINPKGETNKGKRVVNEVELLEGNPCWKERFNEDGTMSKDWCGKARFLPDAHHFLGYDNLKHKESIDNDQLTIWTNLSPFVSNKGKNDLPKDLSNVGIQSTLDLISIVKPKRIILLGVGAFELLSKYAEHSINIEYNKVFDNLRLEVGRINQIPSVCVTHPSGKWDVSNKFIPVFIFLHGLTDRINDQKPLCEIVQAMRNEVRLWLTRIKIDANDD